MKTTAARVATLSLAVLAVASCGGNSTGPSQPTTMSVAVGDRVGLRLAQGVVQALGAPEAAPTSFSGAFSGTAQAAAFTSADGWVDVGTPANVTFDVQGTTESTFVTAAEVPEGTYTKLRLTLSGFSLHLNPGAVIGGVTFDSAVDVAVGGSDGSVVLEVSVPSASLTAGSSATAHFDLNSEEWVSQSTVDAGAVDDATVQAAASASITTG